MRTTRTFVAVPVPDSLNAKLTRLQSLLAPDLPAVRWSMTTPFHMTLAFLGDVADTELNTICRTVEEAAAAFPPFDLRIEGLGVFPNPSQARVIWVGLTGPGLSVLNDARASLASSLAALGYPCDEEFHPHVTLGRMKRKRGEPFDLTRSLNHYRTWSAGSFNVPELVTFASTLTSEGPEYAPLSRAALKGRKPRS
jgi:2'-5' RNA ligase